MFQNHRCRWRKLAICLALGSSWAVGSLWAQPAQPVPLTLKQAFEATWSRQPEALSMPLRRDAAQARRQGADNWLAEPPSLAVAAKTDQFNLNSGSREYVLELALPLWLPGERSRTAMLGDAELRATSSGTLASQLRTAATVREAWWAWQRARIDQRLAEDRLTAARQLALDVVRRVKAGDLARSDQYQADSAVALAEGAMADVVATAAAATQQLRALVGRDFEVPRADIADPGEPVPGVPTELAALDTTHPAVIDLLARAEVARQNAELAQVQTRANPEVTFAVTRDRSTAGDPYRQMVTAGIRIPVGSTTLHRAKVGMARAEATEAEAQLRLERDRVAAVLESARARVDSARAQRAAAVRRAQLARELRGAIEKSFRHGESDLPTRLRVELEAVEAERQAARSHIDVMAAVSQLRQALGLLPD